MNGDCGWTRDFGQFSAVTGPFEAAVVADTEYPGGLDYSAIIKLVQGK